MNYLEAHTQEVCSRVRAELPGIPNAGLARLAPGHEREAEGACICGTAGPFRQRHIKSKFVVNGAYVGTFARARLQRPSSAYHFQTSLRALAESICSLCGRGSDKSLRFLNIEAPKD
jgi:hypothetical protein